jgi:hypothetical protein
MKLDLLSERDKRILALARAVINNMLFSKQNAGRSAEDRYEQKAEASLVELEDLLLTEQPTKGEQCKA